MKKTTWWGAALAGLAMAGCGAADPGSAGADLAYVEESSIEGRGDLFLDPTISWRPMTEAQLGDTSSAIPVEVQVYGGVAVVWVRNGTPDELRTRADIVALFRVLDHVTPALDETYRGDGPVYVPPDLLAGSVDTDIDQTGLHLEGTDLADYALIDFIDLSRIPPEEDIALWSELNSSHPGCLAE